VLNFLRDGIFMIIVAWFFLFCFFTSGIGRADLV